MALAAYTMRGAMSFPLLRTGACHPVGASRGTMRPTKRELVQDDAFLFSSHAELSVRKSAEILPLQGFGFPTPPSPLRAFLPATGRLANHEQSGTKPAAFRVPAFTRSWWLSASLDRSHEQFGGRDP
jgi:hypothetical protein